VSVDQRVAEFTARSYAERVADIAERIREMADRFEREARPRESASVDGTPRYANAAQNALHALTWDAANMHAYDIVGRAAQADAAEASLPQENTGADQP
jgi:hypothetical protein